MSYKYAPDSRCTLILENTDGVMDIYKLLSEAHIDYFYKYAREPRSLIEKYRSNVFVIGSTSRDGVVYSKYFYDTVPINDLLSFYDYVQFLPVSEANEYRAFHVHFCY